MNNDEKIEELYQRIFELETNNDFAKSLQIELLEKEKEIKELKDILKEIDLKFYRCRFVGFNSNKDELKFLYNIINEVRQLTRNGDSSNE